MIERPRLLGLLEQGPARRLTVIKGAAGFGKTSLAVAWAERLEEQGHAVAWLSLDVEDEEPIRFLFYVAHVLREAAGGVGKPAIDLIDEIKLIRPQTIVRALINSLAEVEGDVFLFLDDYHVLTHPDIHESVAYLLRHAPSNLHLVLAARTEPALPLGRWRAQNELLEIDSAALRFDLDETRQFLEQEVTARLDQAQARSLHDKTEGWPAMMRIVATTSVQSGQEFGEYVRRLSSKMRPIRSYITEMFDGLPDEMVGFLLRVSLLDRLCAPLCQAVTGNAHSQELLEGIAMRRLLLIPLDPEGIWFRCHPLLRDFLTQRLAAECALEIPELHRRAYAWFAQAEAWTEAIQHAIAVGDNAQAIDWIEKCAMVLLKRGELMALLAWERLIPADLMKRQIKVRLAIAWGMALAMRFDEALKLTTELEQQLSAAEPKAGPQTVEALGCECQTIRAVAFLLSDDTDHALRLAEESLRRHSSGPWTSNVAANVALMGYRKQGDLARCYGLHWISFPGDDGGRNVVATVYRLCLQGLVEYDQLHTATAARYFDEAMRVAVEHAGPDSVAAAMPASLLAQLRYDQGLPDEAESLVIDRMTAIDAACMLDCVLRAYLVLVRVAMHRGNRERAYALLEQAENLGHARRWDRLAARMILERVRINLAEHRITQAEQGVTQMLRLAQANPAPVRCARSEIHDFAAMAEAALLSSRESHAESAAILRRLLQEARTIRCDELALELAIRLTVELYRGHEVEEAFALCRGALTAAAASGLCQPVLDAPAEVDQALLRLQAELQRANEGGDIVKFVTKLLTRRGVSDQPKLAQAKSRIDSDLLSTREHGVLEQLVAGHSNKDIARALAITPETVKTHVKNIFIKLGVANRAQAASRALSLGLAGRR